MNHMKHFDLFAERISDMFSPLVIKEIRQSLKGKLFLSSFILGIVICLAPTVYFASSEGYVNGQKSFFVFSLILFIGVSFIFPLLSFLSLHDDRSSHTYELVGLTELNAYQLVQGKWQSSAVQMFLFVSSVMPFLTYSYYLRGVPFINIIVALSVALILGQLLNLLAILSASFSSVKWNRVLAYFIFVFVGGGGLSLFVGVQLTDYAIAGGYADFFKKLSLHKHLLFVFISFVLLVICFEWFLYELASGQLAPKMANRSSRCRYAIVSVYSVFTIFSFIVICFIDEYLHGYVPRLEAYSFYSDYTYGFLLILSVFILNENDEFSVAEFKVSGHGRSAFGWLYKIFFMPGRCSGYLLLLVLLLFSHIPLLFVNESFTDLFAMKPSPIYHLFNMLLLISIVYVICIFPYNDRLMSGWRRIATIGLVALFFLIPMLTLFVNETFGNSINYFNPWYYREYIVLGFNHGFSWSMQLDSTVDYISKEYLYVNMIIGLALCSWCLIHVFNTKKIVQTIRQYDAGERGASQ